MKIVLQRVRSASVTVEGERIGAIGRGFLLFIGVFAEDTQAECERLAKKIANLRIFEDAAGKTNLSLADVGGEILAVSQFTLCADCRKGNRPSFVGAGDPVHANALYEDLVARLRAAGIHTETGEFGADMQVELCNDGPFTLVLE
ncbi:MAG: D-tyrosyl-tRNA(Tyr) deacylase [Clostridia bacterium]|nr:D-tyrosyl-tRNA(Tyr) deacylase [Clostridia bacterium]